MFTLRESGGGAHLYVVDGPEAVTVTPNDVSFKPFDDLVASGGRVYLVGDDGQGNDEPWVSNGTLTGTKRLDSINPGNAGSNPTDVIPLGAKA